MMTSCLFSCCCVSVFALIKDQGTDREVKFVKRRDFTTDTFTGCFVNLSSHEVRDFGSKVIKQTQLWFILAQQELHC